MSLVDNTFRLSISLTILTVAIINGTASKNVFKPIHEGAVRIVGGNLTEPNEFPWLVYLDIKIGRKWFTCEGAMICVETELNAAHCLYGRDKTQRVKVTTGEYDLGCDRKDRAIFCS